MCYAVRKEMTFPVTFPEGHDTGNALHCFQQKRAVRGDHSVGDPLVGDSKTPTLCYFSVCY